MAEQKFTDLDWEDVRVFVALARYGSLSAAARALSLTHATVSRRIQALERVLAQTLVERRPDGYVLTPAGSYFLTPATEMEAAASRMVRGAPAEGPKGMVRVNAPPTLTHSFLAARLAELAVENPHLDINVTTNLRNVSLERHETDVALRFGRPEDGDVIARFAAKCGFGFYASESWCKRVLAGAPPVFAGFDEGNAHLPEAAWLSQRFARARVAFKTNTQIAQADASRIGAGIALLPHFLGRTTAGLYPCNLEPSPPSRDLWIITRRQDRGNPTTRTIVEFLTDIFASKSALFE
ncbi:LysR family transcriptional regulator [Caballeronia fortuita]|uniref:LysR family transcriptional regulator n=1 Tax=Caballeronia fortuita TaxID=1777138 RepID=A0A158CTL7_9BURK|nr:LysR family transcriptional regulator [Caballeronia fortuita]SAK85722.1 LysR family transcriptional regulator [Caballeronia fortuita]